MKYLLTIYAEERDRNGVPPEQMEAELGRWFSYTEELEKAGVLVGGDALQPSATATKIAIRDGEKLITDGPFVETKEQLGGYYLLDCPDLDTALEWASKMPNLDQNTVEVRPVQEFEGS